MCIVHRDVSSRGSVSTKRRYVKYSIISFFLFKLRVYRYLIKNLHSIGGTGSRSTGYTRDISSIVAKIQSRHNGLLFLLFWLRMDYCYRRSRSFMLRLTARACRLLCRRLRLDVLILRPGYLCTADIEVIKPGVLVSLVYARRTVYTVHRVQY